MSKTCVICEKLSSYKCPKCPSTYYCSVVCYQKHCKNGCDKEQISTENQMIACKNNGNCDNRLKYPTADTVSYEKLHLLNECKQLGDLLCNPHLRNLLTTINNAKDPEKIMEMAMQEPLFVEFADVCLSVVEENETNHEC